MKTRATLTTLVLVLCPGILLAQETRTLTQMILGVGLPGSNSTTLTPAYAVGVEVRRGGGLGLRLAAEYWEDERSGASGYHSARTAGVQLLGIRSFGSGRLQPYLLGGAGLYTAHTKSAGFQMTATDTGFVLGNWASYERRELLPTLIWGGGASLRIRSTALFTEVKLPLYHSAAFRVGPQSPVLVGIRFE